MNRRTFFGAALSAVGTLSIARALRFDEVWAGPKVQARKGGAKVHPVVAAEESLKGLEKATNVTEVNFWQEEDKIATVQNYCNAAVEKNPKCGDKRQAGQFCGNCVFLQNRVNHQDNVAGKCQLIPDQPPKTLVHGHYYCASFALNPSFKYAIKS